MADTEPMDAEAYLRSKFGAYRGHPEWRVLEAAFNAGRATPPSPSTAPENSQFANRENGLAFKPPFNEVDERAAFEAWAVADAGLSPCHALARNHPGHEFDYRDGVLQREWSAWQARAALASRPTDPSLKPAHERENAESSKRAEVDDEGLPPLPEPVDCLAQEDGFGVIGSADVFTTEQYRQGQRDAVAADRARMPDPKEISDAITEAYNVAYVDRDWKATDYWRGLGKRFSAWAAPAPDANKKAD